MDNSLFREVEFTVLVTRRRLPAGNPRFLRTGERWNSYCKISGVLQLRAGSIQLRPNLTITYGVGWQIDTPIQDIAYNGTPCFAFRPNQQSTVFPNAPVGFVFQGDPGVHASGVNQTLPQFWAAHRFAYSPVGWLVNGWRRQDQYPGWLWYLLQPL